MSPCPALAALWDEVPPLEVLPRSRVLCSKSEGGSFCRLHTTSLGQVWGQDPRAALRAIFLGCCLRLALLPTVLCIGDGVGGLFSQGSLMS